MLSLPFIYQKIQYEEFSTNISIGRPHLRICARCKQIEEIRDKTCTCSTYFYIWSHGTCKSLLLSASSYTHHQWSSQPVVIRNFFTRSHFRRQKFNNDATFERNIKL